MSRKILWMPFLGALALILGLKAIQLDWFAPRSPLELDSKPALLFFNKARGCECELFVYNNANTQMDEWDAPVRVFRIDMDQRPDLVQQYEVIRAPTLVLVNVEGQIVWRQDEGVNDESPLDLDQAEDHIELLTVNP